MKGNLIHSPKDINGNQEVTESTLSELILGRVYRAMGKKMEKEMLFIENHLNAQI